MRRLRAFLGRRRKPAAPVQVRLTFTGTGTDQVFWEYLKKNIRPRGDSGPGVRL